MEDKSLKTQYQVSYVLVKAMYGGRSRRCQGEPTSSANYESRPSQILSSIQTMLSVSLPGSESGSPSGVISCPQLAGQVDITDLLAPMLAEPVSQQSVRYLMRQAATGAANVHSAVCHHDPDRFHPGPGQLAAGGVASRPHPRLPVSTVPTPHRQHVPARPAVGAGLAARPGHGRILHSVWSAGAAQPAGGCQDQAGKPQSLLLSLSKMMDGKTSSGSCPVADLLDHWLADLGCRGRGRQPLLPGPLHPSHPPTGEGGRGPGRRG